MRHRFHSICPYFAMFPETFVEKHLAATKFNGVVFDPFCGRGTTIFESLLRERSAAGCDIHPVAACIAGAKSDAPKMFEVTSRLEDLEDQFDPFKVQDYPDGLEEFFALCLKSIHTGNLLFYELISLGTRTVRTALSQHYVLELYMGNLIRAPTTLAIECHERSALSQPIQFVGGGKGQYAST